MAKLIATIAALVGKESAGSLTDAEAKELAQARGMLAAAGASPAAEGGDEDEDAEGGDDEDEAQGDPPDEESEDDDEDEAEAGGDEDAEAQANRVLNNKAAKGREAAAAKLAVQVVAGKMTVATAIDILKSTGKGEGFAQAALANTPAGVKPGSKGALRGEDEAQAALAAAHKALGAFR